MEAGMISKLSVNINKLATLRNARGGNNPDILDYARKIESFGAHGITVHPRPDQRHITFRDVFALKQVVKGEFNIEGNPGPEFIRMVLEVKPHQVTLVPDAPEVLTSNAGWDTIIHQKFLKETISVFKNEGIRCSIFLDPNVSMVDAAASSGADRIELYTEKYASGFRRDPHLAIEDYIKTAVRANEAGLEINAGHDLDLHNLQFFASNIPNLKEVSIGHALICDALEYGMANTVKMYLNALNR